MSEYDDNEHSSLNAGNVPKDIVDDILGFETGISTNTGFLSKTHNDSSEEAENEAPEEEHGLEFIPYVDYRQLESDEIKEETVYDGIVIWDEELEELDHITDVEREELQEYRDMDNPDGEEEEEEEEPEPETLYTEDEYNEAIAKALAEGQSIGFDAGREQALTEADVQRQDILEVISQRFAELKVQIEQSESEYLDLAVNVAMGIVKKLFPSLAFKYNTNEILSVIEQAVEVAATQPRLIVRVSEDHKKELEEKIIAIAHSHAFEGRLVVRTDENIGDINVQIDWGEGSAIRNPLIILERINNTLAGVIEKSLWNCDLGIRDPHAGEMKKDTSSILSDTPTDYNLPGNYDDIPPSTPDNTPDDHIPPPTPDNTPDDHIPPPTPDNAPDDHIPPPTPDNSLDDDLPPLPDYEAQEEYDNEVMPDDTVVDMGGDSQENITNIDEDMGDNANQTSPKSMDESFSDLEESMKMMGIEPE